MGGEAGSRWREYWGVLPSKHVWLSCLERVDPSSTRTVFTGGRVGHTSGLLAGNPLLALVMYAFQINNTDFAGDGRGIRNVGLGLTTGLVAKVLHPTVRKVRNYAVGAVANPSVLSLQRLGCSLVSMAAPWLRVICVPLYTWFIGKSQTWRLLHP